MKLKCTIIFFLFCNVQLLISQSWDQKLSEINELTQQKDWPSALSKTKALLSETETEVGKEHLNYATVLSWLGYIYKYSGTDQLDTAEKAYKESFEIAKKLIPENDERLVPYVLDLAYLHYDQNKFDSAVPYYEQAIAILKNNTQNTQYWLSLYELSMCYYNNKTYDKALAGFLEIEANDTKPEVKDQLLIGPIYTRIGLIYKQQNDFGNAEIYLKKALSDCTQSNTDQTKCIVPLENLGDLYLVQKEDAKADIYYSQSWELQKNPTQFDPYLKTLTQNLITVNTYLNKTEEVKKYGTFLWNYLETFKEDELLASYQNGADFFKRANQPELYRFLLEDELDYLQRKTPNDTKIHTVLNRLGKSYKDQKEYPKAEDCFSKAIAFIQANGNNSTDLLANLDPLIRVLNLSGKTSEAKKYTVLRETVFEKQANSPEGINKAKLKKALYYTQNNQQDEALKVLTEVKPFFETQKEVNLRNYLEYLNVSSNIYLAIKQYEKAAPILLEGYQRSENNPEYLDQYTLFLIKIADFYIEAQDYTTAANFYSHGITILKSYTLDKGVIELLYARLANVYMLSKNYDAAEQIYTTVIPVYQDVFGTNSSKVFEIKNNYAALLTITKKYTEAEALYLNLETDFANKNSLLDNETTVLYFNIANVFYAEDKLPEAIQYYRKFLDVYIQKINSDFTFLSESEKQNYLLANEEKYHYLMNFYHNLSDKTPVLDDIFRLQSSFRGMILQSSVDIKKKWKTSENPELSKLLSDWEKNQKLKNSYQFEGNNDEAIKTQFILDELEREMARKIPDYASLNLVGNINWKELQSGLQSNEVLIEFIQFEIGNVFTNWENDQQYAALIISPKSKELIYQPLFKQSELESILKQEASSVNANELYRGAVGSRAKNNNYGKQLYEILWRPLLPFLKDNEKIYIIPSGTINQLALAAIPVDEQTVLMEHYQLAQRNGYRSFFEDVATGKPENFEFELFGGIDYDAQIGSTAATTSGAWSYLAGTLDEVTMLSSIISSKTNHLYTGSKATEKVFYDVTQTPTPKVLHLATHGYFFKKPNKNMGSSVSENSLAKAKNPLLRSGLILAGGNHSWSGTEPTTLGNDGILSAAEVSNLNLENTYLVVLSACETGLGDISGNEGVFGLQRAFKTAGANYLLMSLWKVPDAETSEFMQHFYTEWNRLGDLEEAFRSTQKIMKATYPNEPYKWAAFVLVK